MAEYLCDDRKGQEQIDELYYEDACPTIRYQLTDILDKEKERSLQIIKIAVWKIPLCHPLPDEHKKAESPPLKQCENGEV